MRRAGAALVVSLTFLALVAAPLPGVAGPREDIAALTQRVAALEQRVAALESSTTTTTIPATTTTAAPTTTTTAPTTTTTAPATTTTTTQPAAFSSGFDDVTYQWRQLTGGFANLPSIFDWVDRQIVYYQPNDSNPQYPLAVVNDPTGSGRGQVLRLKTEDSGNPRRAQWSLWQHAGWSDTGQPNQYAEQTFAFDMYVEPITAFSHSQRSSWLMLWESHAWADEPTRHGIYLEKRANSADWYLRTVQERPEGTLRWENTDSMWDTSAPVDPALVVPLGKWVRIEILYRYHPTDGRFRVAVDGVVVGDYQGATQAGSSLFDIELFKVYHDGAFGSVTVYYDNVEIR